MRYRREQLDDKDKVHALLQIAQMDQLSAANEALMGILDLYQKSISKVTSIPEPMKEKLLRDYHWLLTLKALGIVGTPGRPDGL